MFFRLLGGIALLLAQTMLTAQATGNRVQNLTARWHQSLSQLATLPEAEQVASTNRQLNQWLRFRDDRSARARLDHWATPAETLRTGVGDCEDYAILKYFTLRALGVAPDKLWLSYVKVQVGAADSTIWLEHMVLAYYAQPEADPLILDNLVGSLYPLSQRPDLQLQWMFNRETWRIGPTHRPANQLPQWRALLARMRHEASSAHAGTAPPV